VSVRNAGDLRNESSLTDSKILRLPYDVNSWYAKGNNSGSLISYNTPAQYRIFYDSNELERFLGEAGRLYGESLHFRVGKILMNLDIKKLWRKCEPITAESNVC
jgi:hypothetical protein